MGIPYGESKFYTEQVVQRNVRYPFWNFGERSCKVYSERVNVHLDHYNPLNLDTRYAPDKRAVLVYESPPEYIDAKVVELSREYATIPGDWSEYVTYNWEVPGIITSATQQNISLTGWGFWEFHRNDSVAQQYFEYKGINTWSFLYARLHRFSVPDASLFSQGLEVDITLRFNAYQRSVGNWHFTFGAYEQKLRAAVVAVDGNNIYTDTNPFTSLFSGLWVNERLAGGYITMNTAREPRGQAVTARVDHHYFHAVNPDAVWKPTERFSIIDPAAKTIAGVTVSNAEGDTIKDNTTPNYATYKQWINEGRWLQAEPSKLNRWMGNIWEVTTIYVRAM